MKRNKHLLLWSSVATLALLVVAAAQENFGKSWRGLQKKAQAAEAEAGRQFDVRLRQVVVPAIDATDRCVSCHVGMAPGEKGIAGDRVLGPHPRVVHDPSEFGCTICHAGQGRATETAEAHGWVLHWPQPMIPLRFAEAGCGTCHTHLEVPNLQLLRRGERLFERYDCASCHALDGRGGAIRPGDAAGTTAPDLSLAGATGYRVDWYDHHLDQVELGADPAWTRSFGPIAPDDLAAFDVLLRSRVGAPKLIEAKALFHSLGCRGCHRIGDVGGDDGPDLTRAGEKDPGQLDFSRVTGAKRDLSAWHAAHFRNPGGIVPGSQMPALGIAAEEIDLLTLYMWSLRRSPLTEAYWPKDRILVARFGESEFSRDGATLYGTFCSACHGRSGEGMRYAGMPAFPAIASRGFLELASDQLIAETIRRGRPGRRMPAWGASAGGLSDGDVRALVAHVRALGGGVSPAALPETIPPAARGAHGPSLYARHCGSCHGPAGEGGEGPSLANRVLLESASDVYFFETIRRGRQGTSMESFSIPSATHAALSDGEIAAIVHHIRSWDARASAREEKR